jgi:hypothetical protein
MNPVFQQNYDQIQLDIAFAQSMSPTRCGYAGSEINFKVQHLIEFSRKHIKDSYCFAITKGCLEQLNKEEIATFADALEIERFKDTEVRRLVLLLLVRISPNRIRTLIFSTSCF